MLVIEGLQAFYGASQILQGIDLQVDAGEIVSLLGRNGSGRSTAARAIMGLVERQGRLQLDGQDLLSMSTWQIARAGIGYVPETREVFPTLSVEENLQLGRVGKHGLFQIEDCYRLFPLLRPRARVRAAVLSGGEQQMLALARAMMGDPRLLIVDEPTEGLAPAMVALIGRTLMRLSEQGVAILLIEQRLAIALQVSRRLYILGRGKTQFAGTPAQLRENPALASDWLSA
jgi:branched-chain amino acid transport system ATP-binding protein